MSPKYCLASYTHRLNGKPTTLSGPALALSKYLGNDCHCIWQTIPIAARTSVYYFLKIRDIWLVLTRFKKSDTCVCVESVNSIVGAFLRKCGAFKKVIYWNMDYGTQRGGLWDFLDRLAVKLADETWVLSKASVVERRKKGVLKPIKIVKVGNWYHEIPRLPYKDIDKRAIVYIGLLEELQGVDYLLDAFRSIPNARLTIIGTGPTEARLRKIADPRVHFTGLISDEEAIDIMCHSAVGVAPYVTYKYNNSMYTDPTKPKTYISCGLPVVISHLGDIGKEIEEKKAGVLIKHSLSESIIHVLDNLKEYREGAIKMAEEYDWNKIFERALK